MKLSIEKNDLSGALNHVQSAVENRTTIPILSNVLMRAESGELTLTTTDMDMSIVERVQASIGVDGELTAPAKTLYEIARKLPDGSQIHMELDDATHQLRVHSGRSKFNLQTLDPKDFPVLSDGNLPHHFQMKADDLKHLLNTTSFAISNEETRYYLNGIYFHIDPDSRLLVSVATDGHRLAKATVKAPDGSNDIPGIIIPRKAVGELRRLLEEYDDVVEISISEAKIRFAIGQIILTSKLIDGKFPDYSRVIPSSNDQTLELNSQVLNHTVDRVTTIAVEKVRAVKMSIQKKLIKLSASSTNNNSHGEDEIECDYNGKKIEIGFNAKYLSEIAGQIAKSNIIFKLSDETSPALIYNSEDDSVLFVLMPMRI
ncbi:MAG: DNA polymerase III subunit beta [Pseudomonadota bacterium]